MTRPRENWSCHDKRHPEAPGTPFQSAGHMGAMYQSCIRCGVHRPPSELESDARMRYQKRCIDREACATARGGKA